MNSNAKTVKTLSLVTAILGTILAIPVLGGMVNQFSILSIASVVLSVIILIKVKDTNVTKTASVLTIISAILGVIGMIVLWASLGAATSSVVGSTTDAEAAGAALGGVLAGGLLGSLFSFPSWILLIIGTIFHYINFSKIKEEPQITETIIDVE